MENTDKTYSKLKPFIVLLIFMTVGLGMLSLSWQKWPNILVDFGRELYIPWRINNGEVLYRDIAHFNGPFSPYLNSFLFKIFGSHLMTIAIFNIILIIVLTWVIYRIFLITTDKLVAVATGVAFLSMFAFSQYELTGNYNFVCPYSHELTHGIFLSYLSIYFFSIYLNQRKDKLLGIIGILMGLIFLTKMEVFLAISLAILAGVFFILLNDKSTFQKVFKILGLFFCGFFSPIIIFVIYLARYMSFNKVLSSITTSYKAFFQTPVASNIFYQGITGMDAPMANVIKLLTVSVGYIIITLALIFVAFLVRDISSKYSKRVFIYTLFGILALSIRFLINFEPWFDVFRPLPLIMMFLVAYFFKSLFKFRNNIQKTNRLLTLFVMAMFGSFLLLKMILNVHIFHYGFSLALPATLLLIMLILYQFPMFLDKLFGESFFNLYLGLIIVLTIMVFHIAYARQLYNLKTQKVGSGLDTIISFKTEISNRGLLVHQTLEKIKRIIDENDNFIVLPEGVMLNYLSRRPNPTPYIQFMPPELMIFGEDKILESFVRNKPDYVVLVDRDTSEYGYPYFGKDYGVKMFAWVKKNYVTIFSIGSEPFSGMGFGITINKYIANT